MSRSPKVPLTLFKLLAPGLDAALAKGLVACGWEVVTDPAKHAAQHAAQPPAFNADAVLVGVATVKAFEALLQRQDLTALAQDTAWVVRTDVYNAQTEAALFALGAEDVVSSDETQDPQILSRLLDHAVRRKRKERTSRNAYATDLATGLPHQAQLKEHMTQLLALREREPAPMVLLVLHMQGLVQVAQQQGAESANVLRRKVAVRLRSGLRASDVVASISTDAFGVLLGHVESSGDAGRVVAKLLNTLHAPFTVAGEPFELQATVGMALYPEHGNDAETLIKRASAQASSVAALGLEGYGAMMGGLGGQAANDGAQ